MRSRLQPGHTGLTFSICAPHPATTPRSQRTIYFASNAFWNRQYRLLRRPRVGIGFRDALWSCDPGEWGDPAGGTAPARK